MCYERWKRRERGREERFEEEVRYLIDEERPRREPRAPVLEREGDEESRDPERVRLEAGTRA
jgi:predicted metal-dependent hydrolase